MCGRSIFKKCSLVPITVVLKNLRRKTWVWSLPYVKEWWIQARHYYIHGESESASLRRLMVEEGRDEDGNAVITLSPNEAVEENPTTDMECGLPSQSDDATH